MNSLRLLVPLSMIAALSACGGKGSSAPMPTNFQVTAQDSQLHMTWDALSGVEYWVFCAPGATTIDSHSPSATHSGWYYFTKIYSGEYYATGLTNGTSYACTVNGRYDSGPGGRDATPVVRTPLLAGAYWDDGNTLALQGMTVRAVAAGWPTGSGLSSDLFVAVGSNGNVVTSSAVNASAIVTWDSPAQPTTSTLNAVSFYKPGNRFVAVGNNGKVVYASTASSWTEVTMPSATGVSMNALTSSGSPLVAVGGNDSGQGAIYVSSDSGASWSSVSGTGSNALNSVVYVPDSTPYWIAVGDGGAVLRSTDGSTWTASTQAGTSANFRSVAVMSVTDSAGKVVSYRLAAVADDGTILSSTDGSTWTRSNISGAVFVAVQADKSQFMAIDSLGKIYLSSQSVNNWAWSATLTPSGMSSPVTLLRYTPSFSGVSSGWMAFNAAAVQRIAR